MRQTRGSEALAPHPRWRQTPPRPRGAPSVLRGGPSPPVHHVWRTDRTSMRLPGGVISRVAVRAWCRRSVRSGAGAMTRDVGCGLEALAPARAGAQPAMCTRAPGAPCPRLAGTGRRAAAGSPRRRDGRGRARDHVLVERWWRTVQEAEVSWKAEETPREALPGCATFLVRSNKGRQPQALGDQTPAAVSCGSYLEQTLFILALFCLDDGVRFNTRQGVSA